jgi:SAM-dependent methyltransferase
MDRQRYSAIAHRDLQFCSPVSPDVLARLLASLTSPPRSALDLGAGHGGMAVFVAERTGAMVDAVDRSPAMIDLARERLKRSAAPVTVHQTDAAAFANDLRAGRYDLVLAVGIDALFGGGVTDTLRGLVKLVRPDGWILFGHTYWLHQPHPAYLSALGIDERAMSTHAGNVADTRAAGLVVIDTHEATLHERDQYEADYLAGIARYLGSSSDDPDAAAFRERATAQRTLYEEHGRRTLGFGLYLLQRPA